MRSFSFYSRFAILPHYFHALKARLHGRHGEPARKRAAVPVKAANLNTMGISDFDMMLKTIEKDGFQCDLNNLIRDMCRQFPDNRFFIKEYVVNASDAGATLVTIRGSESEGFITITISDDGKGMNKSEAMAFFDIFHSRKAGDQHVAGQFGIGKLAVAAIPGQTAFEFTTSNGRETWFAKTGSLIRNEPVRLSRLTLKLTRGTTFRITYKLETTLYAEMQRLKKILTESVPFLKTDILIYLPQEGEEPDPFHVNQEWPGCGICFHKTWSEIFQYNRFKITLGIGQNFHALFQNSIFITSGYNLLSPQPDKVTIHKLVIMVESVGFELPFGRHTLQNEEILEPLRMRILWHLPEFFENANFLYNRGNLHILKHDFDIFTGDLIYNYYNRTGYPWLNTPVFKGVYDNCYAYNDLYEAVRAGKFLFLADPTLEGIDFSAFNGIVLSSDQPGKCNLVLREHFPGSIIDLNIRNLIMEEINTTTKAAALNEREKNFQKFLGFNNLAHFPRKSAIGDDCLSFRVQVASEERRQEGSAKLLTGANRELEKIRWKISRLVERDGKSRCTTHLYLFDKINNSIILNLYHPRIAQLVALTDINPALAAHFAMALALLDKQNILPHIDAETRESLLMLDAMSRISLNQNWSASLNDEYNRFLRNLHDFFE